MFRNINIITVIAFIKDRMRSFQPNYVHGKSIINATQ